MRDWLWLNGNQVWGLGPILLTISKGGAFWFIVNQGLQGLGLQIIFQIGSEYLIWN